METETLECGHAPGPGAPYNGGPENGGGMGWQFVLDGERKICHACADARILECGHTPSPHALFTTGYGIRADGTRACYACCANDDREAMKRDGRATLYLTRDKAGNWQVSNWPGSLTFPARSVTRKPRGGGFGSQRTDAYFTGPDGFTWHAVNRGGNDLAHCRRMRS